MRNLFLCRSSMLLAIGAACLAAASTSALAEDIIKGRIINTHGQGLPGVEIRLVDRENTMMDVTRSGPDGYYVIDLSTLEDEELSSLRGFSLVAGNKGDIITRKPLAGSNNGKSGIDYQAIVMSR